MELLVPEYASILEALAVMTGFDRQVIWELCVADGGVTASGAGVTSARSDRPRLGWVCGDQKEMWERLETHDVIPVGWASDERHSFDGRYLGLCVHGNGTTCYKCARWGEQSSETLSHPPTFRQCAAFASDVPGVLAAEELVREFYRRLAPWGAKMPERFVWRGVHRREYEASIQVSQPIVSWKPYELAIGDLRKWLYEAGYSDQDVFRGDGLVREPFPLSHYEYHRIRWEFAANVGLTTKPSPLEPIVDLWRLGYGLDGRGDEEKRIVFPYIENYTRIF